MSLTLYIGRGSVMLGIQGVELLVQPVLGRDPGRSGPLKHALPTCTEPFEIETAQMRDLAFDRGFGRATIAMFLSHCSGRLLSPIQGGGRGFAVLDAIHANLVSLL